jgi:hypothetical protein
VKNRKQLARGSQKSYKAEDEQFLNRTVATDSTWIPNFEPQLKSQSSWWKHTTSPLLKKVAANNRKLSS